MGKAVRWWTKTRGLPKDVYESWACSLAAHPGRQIRILAWARLSDGFAVGSPAALSYGDGTQWTHIGWHQIENGGWDAETRRLGWALDDAQGDSIELSEPSRLPELFRERVAASIVLEQFVPLLGHRGVLISGRRDLSEAEIPIIWNARLGAGLSWRTEGIRAAAEEAVARLRAEYDRG